MNGRATNIPPAQDSALLFFSPTRRWKEFWLLTLIADNAALSQHRIARTIGISSAMTNTYIKDFIARGYLGTSGATNRSMRYGLTAAGRKAKRQLLHLYGREVARLHNAAREEYRKRLAELVARGLTRVVIFGAATTGELVYQAALQTAIEVLAVVDNDRSKQGQLFGPLVVQPASLLDQLSPDAVIIAAFGRPDEIYDQIKHVKQRRIAIVRF